MCSIHVDCSATPVRDSTAKSWTKKSSDGSVYDQEFMNRFKCRRATFTPTWDRGTQSRRRCWSERLPTSGLLGRPCSRRCNENLKSDVSIAVNVFLVGCAAFVGSWRCVDEIIAPCFRALMHMRENEPVSAGAWYAFRGLGRRLFGWLIGWPACTALNGVARALETGFGRRTNRLNGSACGRCCCSNRHRHSRRHRRRPSGDSGCDSP